MSESLRFTKHYTISEAAELIPQVSAWLVELRNLQRLSERGSDRNAALFAEGRDLGGERINGQLRELTRMRELAEAFESREIQIKDLRIGSLCFPAMRGGREVFLCWIEGETRIGYWHDLDEGDSSRRLV